MFPVFCVVLFPVLESTHANGLAGLGPATQAARRIIPENGHSLSDEQEDEGFVQACKAFGVFCLLSWLAFSSFFLGSYLWYFRGLFDLGLGDLLDDAVLSFPGLLCSTGSQDSWSQEQEVSPQVRVAFYLLPKYAELAGGFSSLSAFFLLLRLSRTPPPHLILAPLWLLVDLLLGAKVSSIDDQLPWVTSLLSEQRQGQLHSRDDLGVLGPLRGSARRGFADRRLPPSRWPEGEPPGYPSSL